MQVSEPDWGQFVFVSRGQSDPRIHQTSPPAHDIVEPDAIPTEHPGLREFGTPSEARAAFPGEDGIREPSYVPGGYTLVGCYVVANQGDLIDFTISFGRDEAATLFSADLAVMWTARAPMPLPARTYELSGEPLGRRGLPLRRVRVREYAGVMQEWVNPAALDRSLRIQSSLNWFDDRGRLWAVQGSEGEEILIRIAESLVLPA